MCVYVQFLAFFLRGGRYSDSTVSSSVVVSSIKDSTVCPPAKSLESTICSSEATVDKIKHLNKDNLLQG